MSEDADDVEDCNENNILYDLTIHAEWPQEAEPFTRNQKEKPQVSVVGRLASATQRTVWTSLRTLGLSSKNASPCSLPADLVRLVNSQINWHIAISSDGNVLSVIQDQHVEIRSAHDEYGSIVGRGNIGKDPYPQWRRTAWSPDSTMVAVSSSAGTVTVFDVVGSTLMVIPGEAEATPTRSQDLSEAVAGLIFIETPESSDWSTELLVVNYHGTLKSYFLEREKGFKFRQSFQFSNHYPLGLGDVIYHSLHKLLLLGGTGDCYHGGQSPNQAAQEGITAWRVLSGPPYYKLVTDYSDDLHMAQQHGGLTKRLRNFTYYSWYGYNPEGIFKLCLSPNGQMLVTIHQSGKLSLWDVPSLRRRHSWIHDQQPGHDDISPDFEENPVKRKVLKDIVQSRSLIDVSWWSNKEVILARCSGAVSVSSTETLRNLLGTSPEWFEPAPHVTESKDGGFLGLECECQFPSLKRRLVATTNDEEYDDSDDDEASLVTRTTRLTKQMLYYITDIERFQPPRKRPRLVTRTYRLVRLKSTTPEELYEKKISNEEYGEALALARAYGLDCDKVYQRQWRKSPVSVASIQDYLSKISKRSWVLHECLERVPENIDAMKELLEYGLRGTDLQALIAIGKGQDGGRFILCDLEDEEYEDIQDEYNNDRNEEEERRKDEKRQELLKQVDFNSLNLEQRQLCKDRLRLLQYLDKLNTYELILGGKHAAEMRFDNKFFEKFRTQNIIESAVDYARMSDDKALDILLTFHGEDLGEHRLAILSNFPETTSPYEYRSLLPEISGNSEMAEPWPEDKWRNKDWCEQDVCRNAVDPHDEDMGALLYNDNTDYEKFRAKMISSGLLSEWYDYRACEIESLASQVDFSLELVKLALERGVQNLESLHADLITMETMVYECGLEDGVEFTDVRKMSNLEKLQLLMSKSPVEMYCKNVRRWMVPYLQRCESKSPGAYNSLLGEYIVTTSKSDLTLTSKLFELSKPGVNSPVIKDSINMMSMALDAIYATEREDQLKLAVFIFECLPNKSKGRETPDEIRLNRLVDELERHLRAAGILEKYGLKLPLNQIKQIQSDPEDTKNLIVKLTRVAGRCTPSLKENNYWSLLDDVQIIQSQVFKGITQDLCLQIFSESLLCSGKQETISLVGELIERSATEKWDSKAFHGKLTYEAAISLVIQASREYFDSSASLTDPSMDLARACLHLIRDTSTAIQDELDLVSSLAILDDFGVSTLPLQVRLSKDRLSLVDMCVDNRPTAYKQSQKLLRLGHLLRVPGETQVDKDGQVLYLVVNAAIKNKDYEFANEICQELMSDNYDPIWTACRDLAEQVEFRDIKAKAELLSFAVTYCDAAMIEPILKAKCLLESQILFDSVTDHMESTSEGFVTPRSSPFSTTSALQQTQQLLASTTETTKHLFSTTKQTTKAVLSTVTDSKWWQKTIMSLKQPTKLVTQSSLSELDDGNSKFEKQGCPEFYASLIQNSYVSKKCYNEDEITLSGNLLRTAKLEELLTEGLDSKPCVEVLQQLSSLTLPYDSILGLSYLLSLTKGEDAESVFEDLPNSAISLQLATYYYSLQIYAHLLPYLEAERAPLYSHAPSDVIQTVIEHVSQKKDTDWPKEIRALVEKVKMYHDLLEDYSQAKILQGLGRGVDVVRFTEDTEYKHETIIGLAMTLEDEVFKIAVSLAERYNLSLWEVYMTHLDFLFSDSGLSTDDVETRVETLDLLSKLTSKSGDFTHRMETCVLPTIEGTDHSRLLYYYSLLSSCDEKVPFTSVSPDVHIKLLNKLKSATPGLDYKKLMDKNHEALDVIQSVLNSTNVHVVAKLANKIPDKSGGYLTPSVVFASWSVKLFWQGDQTNKRKPQTTSEWVHRYEACGEFLQRLLPSDLLSCAGRMVFTSEARATLTLECRTEITKRLLKLSRQQAGKKKKMDLTGSRITWEDSSNEIQGLLTHLGLLTNETILSLSLSAEKRLQEYAEMYDLSKGNIHKVKGLLVQMILDGGSPDLIEDTLSVNAVEKWTPRTAVQQAVISLINTLQGNESDYDLREKEPLSVLKIIVASVQEHQDAEGDLVCSEDLVSLLRPFCADSSVPAQPRLDVLEMLEKAFPVSDEDMVLLTLYRTNAIVSSAWKQQQQLKEDQVNSDETRQSLFNDLINKSTSVDQYLSLSKLLRLWPTLPTTNSSSAGDTVTSTPWSRLFSGLTGVEEREKTSAVLALIQDVQDTDILTDKTIQYVSELLLEKGEMVAGVKSVLLSSHQHLYPTAVVHLKDIHPDSVEDDMLDLILRRGLITQVVEFAIFEKLTSFIVLKQMNKLTGDSYLLADNLGKQLHQAGYISEAGALLLQCRGTHPILQTFSAARNVLGKWLRP